MFRGIDLFTGGHVEAVRTQRVLTLAQGSDPRATLIAKRIGSMGGTGAVGLPGGLLVPSPLERGGEGGDGGAGRRHRYHVRAITLLSRPLSAAHEILPHQHFKSQQQSTCR